MSVLPLTAHLDNEEHTFFKVWGESTCKLIASSLSKQHARFELFGQTIGYNKAWRYIEQFFGGSNV